MICFAIGRLSSTYIYSTSPCVVNDSSSITKLAAHNKYTTGTKKKKIDISNIKSMRKAAQDLVDMLDEYYNGKEQAEKMMLGSWLSPWEFNSTDKLVDTMVRAIVNQDQDEFIIGIIGSSVAGKSALVLFYDMNSSVQYEVSNDLLHLALVYPYLIAFANNMY